MWEAPQVPPDLRHGRRGWRWRPLLRAEGLDAGGEGWGSWYLRPFLLLYLRTSGKGHSTKLGGQLRDGTATSPVPCKEAEELYKTRWQQL